MWHSPWCEITATTVHHILTTGTSPDEPLSKNNWYAWLIFNNILVLSRVRDNTLKDEGDLRKRCALYLQRFHTWCFPVCNALPQSRQRRHTHLMSPSAALQTSAPCYSGTDPHTPKDYNRYRTSSVNYQMNKKLHS